jgi:hypothetical protein
MKVLDLLLIAVVVFTACTKNTIVADGGGGNDFPNPHTTASALGKAIADNLSSGDHWGDSIIMPQSLSASLATQSVSIPSIPETAPSLAKKSATSISLHYDLSDTLHGIVRVYYSVTSDSAVENDTLVMLYDAAFRDTSEKNKHLYSYEGITINKLSHIKTHYRFADSDGDSIINNRDGKPNQVIAEVTVINPLGGVDKTMLSADGGADNNLDTKADNRLLAFSYVKLSAQGDTASFTHYESFSGASFIIDPTRTDSCLVRLRSIDTDILLRRTVTEAVFAVFPSDSVKNYPVYVQSSKFFDNGKIVTSLVRGARLDSLLYAGDTAWARIIVDSPNDIAIADTLQYGVLLGKNPGDSSTTSLLSIRRHVVRRLGDERESIFSVKSDWPLAHNQALQSGSLSLTLNYADGQWIHIDGTFTSDKIIAVFTDSKEDTLNLAWDRSGTPVQ